MKLILTWITKTRFFKWIILKFLPHARLSNYYAEITGKQYHEAYKILKPCDLIFTIDKSKIVNHLIKGDWSHVALFRGLDAESEIAEMISQGFTESYFYDVCKSSDDIAIGRLKLPIEYKNTMLKLVPNFRFTEYDAGLEFGIDAIYCSEFIYWLDYKRQIKFPTENFTNRTWPYISPDDLFNAENIEIVYDSRRKIS